MEEDKFRELIRKWIAQANHPQNANRPEVRQAKLQCAKDLQQALHEAGSKPYEKVPRPSITYLTKDGKTTL